MSDYLDKLCAQIYEDIENYVQEQKENFFDDFNEDFREVPYFSTEFDQFKLITADGDVDGYDPRVNGVVVYLDRNTKELIIFRFVCDFEDGWIDVSHVCDKINIKEL